MPPSGGGPGLPRFPLTELLPRISAAEPLIGPLVARALTERLPLGSLLRDNGMAIRVAPEPPEATLALAFYLARASHDGGVDLEAFAATSPLARVVAERLLTPLPAQLVGDEGHRFYRRVAEQIEAAISWPERADMIRLLLPNELAQPADLGALSPLPRIDKSDLERRRPRLTEVFQSLGYAAGEVIDLIRAVLRDRPSSLLARALLGLSEPAGDTDEELLALLCRLLGGLAASGDAVPLEALLEIFGPDGRALKEALGRSLDRPRPERPDYVRMGKIVEHLARLMPERPAKVLIDRLVRDEGLIPKRLPILDDVAELVPNDALAGRGLIAQQHLFVTLVPLLEMLVEKGMDPKAMHVFATPYNWNPLVAAYCNLIGIHVAGAEDEAYSTHYFEALRREKLREFLTSITVIDALKHRFRVLDDGGELHAEISAGGFAAAEFLRKQVEAGSEQTSRGLTELSMIELAYPVVKVADCEGKRRESSVIGWSIAHQLCHELLQLGELADVRRMLLAGAGPVGLETARVLRDTGFEVAMAEPDLDRRGKAARDGHRVHPSIAEGLNGADMILGMTGHRSLAGPLLAGYRGLLASGSSGTIEGNVTELDTYDAGGARVLNRMRPVNFQGDGYEDLTADQIGLTRALLFSSLVQDTSGEPNTMVPLAGRLQARAIESWLSRGGDQVRPIELFPAPVLSRPDAINPRGSASHSEWMTFLRNHPRVVCPPPNQSLYNPGTYFFEDPDGKFRIVDTRVGCSQPVELPGAPSRAYPAGIVGKHQTPGRQPWLVTGRGWVARVEPSDAGGWSVSRPWAVEGLATSFVTSRSRSSFELGLAFRAPGKLLVFPPGPSATTPPVEVPLPSTSKDGLVAWPTRHQLVWVDRKSPRVVALSLGTGGFASPPPQVPEEMVVAEGLTRAGLNRMTLLLGRDRSGRQVVSRLYPTSLWPPKALTLPEGAEYRALRVAPDADGKFLVDYAVPGQPDEPRRHQHMEIEPFDV